MTTLNFDLPSGQAEQMQRIAAEMGMNLQAWYSQVTTNAIKEWELCSSFRARAAKGNAALGLQILDELQAQ